MAPRPIVRRTPRTTAALGALIGMQQPTFSIMLPRLPWQQRLVRWAARKALRMVGRLMKRTLWTWRRALAPWYVACALWATAALAHLAERGWVTLWAVGALGTVPLYWWLGFPAGRLTRRRDLKPMAQRLWHVGAYAAWSAWAVVSAATTVLPPSLGIWWVISMTVWIAWMWHHRTRVEVLEGVVEEFNERLNRWQKIAGQGKPLAGAELENLVEHSAPKRWEADIALPSGDLTVENVLSAQRRICSAYSARRDNVILDEAPGGAEDRAHLTVVEENPCHGVIEFDDTWLDDYAPGCVPFHTYPDGFRGGFRLWQPRSGTAHAFFSGDTRSGKSAGMEAALDLAVMTGRVWPMVGDPQGGQSMPAWVGDEGHARSRATDAEGVLIQLQAIKAAMYARSRMLQRLRWRDEDGDLNTGIGFFDPDVVAMPMLLYVLDEAHIACKDPECGPQIVALIEDIVKMAGKTGIILWLATQYPGIEELGNKMAIRQNLVAGNVICYRNSASVSKQMVLPSHMPSPLAIPKETPSGEHTKGTAVIYSAAPRSSRATYSRSVWVKRQGLVARTAAEQIPDLDEVTGEALERFLPSALPASPEPEAAPARERIEVNVPQPTRKETAFDKIRAYLEARTDGRAHTGVIADALDMPKGTVGTTLKRAEKAGQAHQPRRGIWALGVAAQEQLVIDTEVAA